MIVATSIYDDVFIPGGETAIELLEQLKKIDDKILVAVKRGDLILIIPVRSLNLEGVTLTHPA